jgi:ribonuclease P protein component
VPNPELKITSLKGDYAFRRLRKGKGGGAKWLNVRVLPSKDAGVRVGIVTSKKVGKATVRNLLRRRIREGLRDIILHKSLYPHFGINGPSFDIVIVVHTEASQADYWQLRGALQHALIKAGVIR